MHRVQQVLSQLDQAQRKRVVDWIVAKEQPPETTAAKLPLFEAAQGA